MNKHGSDLNRLHAPAKGSLAADGAPAARRRPGGGSGYLDAFSPGILLIEMKSAPAAFWALMEPLSRLA